MSYRPRPSCLYGANTGRVTNESQATDTVDSVALVKQPAMNQPELNEDLLEERLTELEAAYDWRPRVVSRLDSLIRTSDDDALFRINSLRYALDQGVEETEAVDLFLYATKAGLFDMDWLIACAACANVYSSFRSLEKLEPNFICDMCSYENEADLDDYIQVAFTVSPQIRSIRFHDPAALSVEELYFRYHRSTDVKPLPAGSTVPQILERWTKLLTYIEPGGIETVEFDRPRGIIGVMDVLGPASSLYVVNPAVGDHRTDLALESDGRDLIDAKGTPVGPFELAIPEGRSFYAETDDPLTAADPEAGTMVFKLPAVGQIATGPVTLTIQNRSDQRTSAWVVEYPPVPQQAGMIEFWPVLSGKQLLSNQTFRSLFRSETMPESETFQVKDLTYLFTDLKDSTLIYDTVGDLNAYDLVRRHFDALLQVVADNKGAITKTIGDAIMATFVNPADGVRSAFDMLAAMANFNQAATSDLILKIGMHRGRSLAVTLNERIDYFGQEVNTAARVQQLASAGEIVLSEDVYRDSEVMAILAPYDVVEESGIIKGVQRNVPVFRVRPHH